MSEPVRDLYTLGDETKAQSSAPITHPTTRVSDGQRDVFGFSRRGGRPV